MGRQARQNYLIGDGYGLLLSAKAATTTVVIWYFSQQGLLEEALSYDPWPHRYKRDVLWRSATYRLRIRRADLSALPWARIIRDPYRRAVSSYRHAVRYDYSWNRIGRVLGRTVNSDSGFSFSEFLEYLGTIDLSGAGCNGHHRQQRHAIEHRLCLARVINIDVVDPIAELDDFALKLGIDPGRGSTRDTVVRKLEHGHVANLVRNDDDVSRTIFTAAEASGGWPEHRAFLNPQTRGKIESLYAADFAAYGPWLVSEAEMRRFSLLPQDFDPATYLNLHPDVAAAKVDPTLHYVTFGRGEGRQYHDKRQ